MDKFISLTNGCLIFFASMRFLERMSGLFFKEPKTPWLNYKAKKEVSFDLFAKRMSFPYEYLYSIVDLNKPMELPNKELFNTHLHRSWGILAGIQRTSEVKNNLRIKHGRDSTLLYLKSDVCVLADIFQKFIKISWESIIFLCQLSWIHLAMWFKNLLILKDKILKIKSYFYSWKNNSRKNFGRNWS